MKATESGSSPGPSDEGSDGGIAIIVLYECRSGRLTRCFQFKDSNGLSDTVKHPTLKLSQLRTTKPWSRIHKYLLKKGRMQGKAARSDWMNGSGND